LNKVVATFEKHIFLSQTDLTRTGIISNSYIEMVPQGSVLKTSLLLYLINGIPVDLNVAAIM
jgi:hypothetical protein